MGHTTDFSGTIAGSAVAAAAVLGICVLFGAWCIRRRSGSVHIIEAQQHNVVDHDIVVRRMLRVQVDFAVFPLMYHSRDNTGWPERGYHRGSATEYDRSKNTDCGGRHSFHIVTLVYSLIR